MLIAHAESKHLVRFAREHFDAGAAFAATLVNNTIGKNSNFLLIFSLS
jgi:hypothetical protein